ncbi:hypothetical protein AQUCO_02700206v1 [Aquilegia coerulea]|uniref:Peptidase A1 domain-containing protein n=1 Tax=Aquilegia coerulea TaxID=218851 RepID=A0A2G5D5R6_AQUCA|nr:hypothetical protein AQUCO_02700206v1 [Aquilegia coerulea]
MAPSMHILVLFFLFHLVCATQGFSMKLIPMDSPESPLYEKNLTQEERFQKLIDLTVSRAHWIGSSRTKIEKDMAATFGLAQLLSGYYMVSLIIGTPGVQFFLLLDTGSHLTWVQAQDCERCFEIEGSSFNYEQSSSFTYLSCDDLMCRSCGDVDDDICEYEEQNYGEDKHSKTVGLLAKDEMTFISDTLGEEKVKVIFGLGLKNKMAFGGEDNRMVGIFGLGPGPYSFISQLPLSSRRFSYCLPWNAIGEESSRLIKFGNSVFENVQNDAVVQTTPLIIDRLYLLNCTGISVNGKNIGISKDVFRSSDFVIDSGAPLTTLVPNIYNQLTKVLRDYFKWLKVRRVPHKQQLCYSYKPGEFYSFPNITFHFQGAAHFRLTKTSAFQIEEDTFCLAIQSGGFGGEENSINMFGAYSQTSHCVIYDIQMKQLSFYLSS